MPSASVSIASAPSMIGCVSPGSQFQIVSPIAAPSAASAQERHQHALDERPGNSPTISTTIEPPTARSAATSPL